MHAIGAVHRIGGRRAAVIVPDNSPAASELILLTRSATVWTEAYKEEDDVKKRGGAFVTSFAAITGRTGDDGPKRDGRSRVMVDNLDRGP